MKIPPQTLRLYAVSDRSFLTAGKSLTDILPLLFSNGVTLFQLREKHLAREAFVLEAQKAKEICRRFHVPLIINDAVDIAKEIGADGVHVGLSDMGVAKAREILGADAIIGASAHNVAEATSAEAAGADYIGCGAVFGSTTKSDAKTLAHSELSAICKAVHIPVVAIGGITQENLPELNGSGIAGVAVISALFAQDDIAAAARSLSALAEQL